MRALGLGMALLLAPAFSGCGGGEDQSDGSGGSAGSGGSIAIGGSSGKSSGGSGGSSSGAAGSGGSGTSGSAGSGSGGQEQGVALGGLCALDEHCSQAGGEAVCCAVEGCASACECVLADACPGSTSYLACESSADCEEFGGGRVCCAAGSMQYCTKPSGCQGDTLP